MKSTIIQLEHSPAIPVPQPLLDQCDLHGEVEVEAQGNCLIVRRPQPPRDGWEEEFREKGPGDALVLNDSAPNQWDEEEWEW